LRGTLGDIELPELNSATLAVANAEGQEQHCRSEVERLDAEVDEVRTSEMARTLKTTKETELRATTEDLGRGREAIASARTLKSDQEVLHDAATAKVDECAALEAYTELEAGTRARILRDRNSCR